jgi:sucrose-6-phosphate hydrolase SacC (GH32 family)
MTGEAFGKGPAHGAEMLRKLEIENSPDLALASSEIDGDAPQGRLTSPEFKIQRAYISFLIAGGDYEHHTCLNLLIDRKIVRSATGWRSDRLVPASWDVSAFRGKRARIEIVDEASGDWGHINVDEILQTDSPRRLPVVTEPLYKEALRPQFHFTARQWTMDRLNPRERQEGWLNDLNGLIFYEGEYHLFAQRWNKCWIHAVSRDLVRWRELEPAFWEEKLDSGVQSGSCVIDYNNTSGLSTDKKRPPMVVFWSRNDNRSQCLSYSLDRGRTWKHYEKNPLMVFPERDPKVFWHEPSKHWVMMMYGEGKYHIFTSTNLLNWKNENHPIAKSYECPDVFPLPIDGDANKTKWVLIQGNGNYSIGDFDGSEFKGESERRACDIGPNFYATQTWGNTETGDRRRIQAAWMRGPSFPDMPFNQQVTFPCELTLRTTTQGLRLFREPIKEIALLHRDEIGWTNRTLRAGEALQLDPSAQFVHLKGVVKISDSAKLILNLRGNAVILTAKTIESGDKPHAFENELREFEILLDRASIETYLNRGEVSHTRFALSRQNGILLKAESGDVEIGSLHLYTLNSMWTEAKR